MVSWLLGAALVWIVCCISIHPYYESDLFWQLRVGHDIVRLRHLPHADSYSWERRGTPWIVPEWLLFVGYWEIYRHFGAFAGLLALRILCNAAMVTLLFRIVCRLSGSPGAAFCVGLAVTMACANYLQTRPYQITFLCTEIVLYTIMLVRRGDIPAIRLFWLAPLCALWTNLHQGVVVALCFLGVYAVCDAFLALLNRFQGGRRLLPLTPAMLDIRKTEDRSAGPLDRVRDGVDMRLGAETWHVPSEPTQAGRWGMSAAYFAAATMACAVATLVSPYGIHAYSMIYATVSSPISRIIVEWMPLRLTPSLQTTALEALVVWIALAYGGSSVKTWDLGGMAVILGCARQALEHQRNVPLFALAAAMIAAPQIAALMARLSARRGPWMGALRQVGAASVAALATLSTLYWTATAEYILRMRPAGPLPAALGAMSVESAQFPEDACRFMVAHAFPPGLRLFNDLGPGGYLIWRTPQYPVFIDGRNDPYFGDAFDNYNAAHSTRDAATFFRILSPYAVDCVISNSPDIRSICAASPQWALVYDGAPRPSAADQTRTFIFLRRTAKLAPVIAACAPVAAMRSR